MTSSGNRTPDLLILSPTPYPLGLYCTFTISFIYVFLTRLLYSAKGISVICLGSDVTLNKSKFIITIIKLYPSCWTVLLSYECAIIIQFMHAEKIKIRIFVIFPRHYYPRLIFPTTCYCYCSLKPVN